MPELPEVEVIRAGLEPIVTDAVVTGVEVADERSVTRHRPGPESFARMLAGRRITGAARRGKFLWLPLAAVPGEAPSSLLAHLGMSGQLLVREPGAADPAHLRIRITLDTPHRGELRLDFADQRTFGSLAVDPLLPAPDGRPGGIGAEAALVPAQAAHIARDPLDPAFDDAAFVAGLAGRSSGIKRVLLDQRRVSGIGNIYADEALWAAGIHYALPAERLGRPRAIRLLDQVRLVLEAALAEGGTSFDGLYVDVTGAGGYFARGLRVYGREGEPCPRCRRPIVREPFMNRSSFRCPGCQRLRGRGAANSSARG